LFIKTVHWVLNGIAVIKKNTKTRNINACQLGGIDNLTSKDIATDLSKLGYYSFVAPFMEKVIIRKTTLKLAKISRFYENNFKVPKRIISIRVLIKSG
jgi:hypothetical protein